jgi:hypothetical protein
MAVQVEDLASWLTQAHKNDAVTIVWHRGVWSSCSLSVVMTSHHRAVSSIASWMMLRPSIVNLVDELDKRSLVDDNRVPI